MPSHLRRLTAAQKSALPGATDHERLFPFTAEIVGTSGGDFIVHVPGSDRSDLPGTFEAADYAGLHSAVRPNVLEAIWEEPADPEDPDGPTVRRRGKMRDVPAGAEPVEVGIEPHHFA